MWPLHTAGFETDCQIGLAKQLLIVLLEKDRTLKHRREMLTVSSRKETRFEV